MKNRKVYTLEFFEILLAGASCAGHLKAQGIKTSGVYVKVGYGRTAAKARRNIRMMSDGNTAVTPILGGERLLLNGKVVWESRYSDNCWDDPAVKELLQEGYRQHGLGTV